MSTCCPKQSKKIAAILALNTTIIFLSDLRLNTESLGFNNLFSPRFTMFHNSTTNRRGVGILISNNLQYTVNAEIRDIANNVIALSITVCEIDLLLISVYGPNDNKKDFYLFLHSILTKYNDVPTKCAGDWNATYSTDPGDSNIDVINMSCPPSCIRSGWLSEICDEFNLSDPYRAINPYKKDFMYVPRARTKNKSRLDFFWVSENLLHL
jgi:exonuclease III